MQSLTKKESKANFTVMNIHKTICGEGFTVYFGNVEIRETYIY